MVLMVHRLVIVVVETIDIEIGKKGVWILATIEIPKLKVLRGFATGRAACTLSQNQKSRNISPEVKIQKYNLVPYSFLPPSRSESQGLQRLDSDLVVDCLRQKQHSGSTPASSVKPNYAPALEAVEKKILVMIFGHQ